tara:strand:+ start:7487 stop:7687 length:201 start_codon:yes stop_codon:yes gene_type:complete
LASVTKNVPGHNDITQWKYHTCYFFNASHSGVSNALTIAKCNEDFVVSSHLVTNRSGTRLLKKKQT